MLSEWPIRRACTHFACAIALMSGTLGFPAVSAEPEGHSFTVECYYRARWGTADEFIRLYRKNHLPVLKKSMEMGRILKLSAAKPRYHASEAERWDYRVTIVFKDAVIAHDFSVEEGLNKQLFPDQEAYKKEEQQRFELLQAHWDVPVEDVALDH
jgi:hypothetical protein